MEPQVREEARLNQSRIEAGEGSPTFGDEIRLPDVLHPAAASTPVLQSLSSGSRRKRTPAHDVRCSRSPEPSAPAAKKKVVVDTGMSATSPTPARDISCSRSPAPSAPATKKKKVTVNTGIGRPTPSATLLPPPPKVPSAFSLAPSTPATKKKAAVDDTGRPAPSAALLPPTKVSLKEYAKFQASYATVLKGPSHKTHAELSLYLPPN